MARFIGLDVHKHFVEVCAVDVRGKVVFRGRIGAVDSWLARTGRLIIVRDLDQTRALKAGRKSPVGTLASPGALGQVAGAIEGLGPAS